MVDSQCLFANWIARGRSAFSNHRHPSRSSSNEVHVVAWISSSVPVECKTSRYRGEDTQL